MMAAEKCIKNLGAGGGGVTLNVTFLYKIL